MTEQHFKLLSATAQGNQQAFAELYELTAPRLLAVSLQLLNSRDLAEDALQEAFIKIWHNAGEYQRDKGEVLAWMISIVRYRAIDILRAAKSRKESSSQTMTEQPDDSESSEPSPEASLAFDRNKTAIDNCMDHLQDEQKSVIELAYFKGMSHRDIVGHTHHPLGSVKSWIRRGLQSLQRCLGQ